MRRHLPFLVILILVAAARIAILLASQTHVHSDEAIIGLMGKHIMEGRYFPFYMYGQPYNAGAAWEAYLAAIPFAVFGVGVVPLKGVIVAMSLACLALFYRMTDALYGRRTALIASLVFALSPSLSRWHFQVRGYSWYFLSIPIATGLFFAMLESRRPKASRVFGFGLASGLMLWNLELALTLIAAFWLLLAARRKLSGWASAAGAAGFVAGYAPAIVFNLTHRFSNWQLIVAEKTGGGVSFRPAALAAILFDEMPKFFGVDTTLWYYPETSTIGYVCYAIAMTAVVIAVLPFLTRPSRLRELWSAEAALDDEAKDLAVVLLTLACAIPYAIAPFRVPGYFLSGCFFLSILAGRLVARCLAATDPRVRVAGAAVLAAAVLSGCAAMVMVGGRDQIETLTLDPKGNLYLTRFPGADLDAVKRQLRDEKITSVWTTVSFVYPLIFESRESLAVSDAIFGWGRPVYSDAVPRHEPAPDQRQVFVLESVSPFRDAATERCAQAGGAPPIVTEHGTLTVIAERPHQ